MSERIRTTPTILFRAKLSSSPLSFQVGWTACSLELDSLHYATNSRRRRFSAFARSSQQQWHRTMAGRLLKPTTAFHFLFIYYRRAKSLTFTHLSETRMRLRDFSSVMSRRTVIPSAFSRSAFSLSGIPHFPSFVPPPSMKESALGGRDFHRSTL